MKLCVLVDQELGRNSSRFTQKWGMQQQQQMDPFRVHAATPYPICGVPREGMTTAHNTADAAA